MFNGVSIASLISSCCRVIKEGCTPIIPAENWANKDLYYKDLMTSVSVEQCLKNAKNGKYKLTETYPEPHRAKDGRIIIENCKLYNEDIKNFGAYQAYQWAKQGKYNLTSEELKKQTEEHKKKMDYIYTLV